MKLKNLGIYNLAIMALLFSFSAKADDMDDVQALLDAYIETESDLMAQTRLMSDDRIFINGTPAMRMTDNQANMKGQIHVDSRRQQMDPTAIYYATREDQIVRVYGDAAVASFRRNLNFRPSAEGMRNGMSNNTARQLVTVVMAKIDGDWKIVHTHISAA
jgi:ketosteroid isomerase-like protein